MQRLHLHINVDDLDKSITYYSALLGHKPSVEKPDYAKWLLDEPRVNLAISRRTDRQTGVNHVGIQVENDSELKQLHSRLTESGYLTQDQQAAQCCYAISNKHWSVDPSGVSWELFKTMQQADSYGDDPVPADTPPPGTGHQSHGCCSSAH